MPSVVHAAADKLPRQFGGGNGKDDAGDDVAADGNLVYPAEGDASPPTASATRPTPPTHAKRQRPPAEAAATPAREAGR